MIRKQFLFLAILATVVTGCAINPVTGQREITLVSESRELDIGRKNYGPSRQMQGGAYTIDKALTAYVQSVGKKLADVSDRRLPYEFVVLNNSTPNAWALPGGKIAVNRGLLLELNSEAELAAVLGHEIVHAAARHGAKGMERGMLLQGAILATGIAISGNDYANQVVGAAQLAGTLVTQKYGRVAEQEADTYGMTYMSRAGYSPKAAVDLQETFVRLSKDQRQDWLSGLFSSHPPSQTRVEANRRTAHTLPDKGVMNAAGYQQVISGLKKVQPAYKAYDQGRKALSRHKLAEAKALARKALSIEPREAQFHALMGDVAFKEKHYPKALTHYNLALERNDSFFYFYMQRGLTGMEMKDLQGAKKDLRRSLDLLPTAIAHNALGNIALKEGDRMAATRHFRTASGSDSESGRQATRSLIRLDLPNNPQKYLKVKPSQDSRGYVSATIHNTTDIAVRDLNLLIRYQDQQGKMQETRRNVPATIAPGKAVSISLGIGPIAGTSALDT
ncbi:MAG: M48 family metalloprotease, partial [Desulfobacterales bacterium]